MKVAKDPSRKSTYRGITFVAAVCVLVSGCATVSPQQKERVMLSLERTRVTLERARADALIATSAAARLFDAEQTLRQAEQTEDFALKEHLAYMAERKAQLAVAIADRNIAENQTLALAGEKDELLLKVREQQAKTAEADAERLAAEAAKAKAEALQAKKEAEKAWAEAAEVEKALAALKAEKTERGMVLTLGDVLFATGEATLSPGAMTTMERLAEFMERYPSRGLVIEGYTDNVGTAEYNMILSSRRADAVKKALVEKGIAAERIATIGYGETYPKVSNDSAASRQQNRRVEVVILDEGVNPHTYKR